MKTIKLYVFAIFILMAFTVQGQNLIDASSWDAGLMPPIGFKHRSNAQEDSFILGENPFGSQAVLWEGKNLDNSGSSGGFFTNPINIDSNQTYRISFWVKSTDDVDMAIQFGAYVRDANGNQVGISIQHITATQVVFQHESIPKAGNWYLYSGYIHKSSYDSNTKLGGIYDSATGNLVKESWREYKFSPEATTVELIINSWNVSRALDRCYFYSPRFDLVNGTEPEISELMDGSIGSGTGSSSSLWSSLGNTINYTKGSVKIGTTEADSDYLLTVNGDIHSKEVHIDLLGALEPPDYVFYEDYELRTLDQVQDYIKKKGHLPNIPSAEEMKKNGIDVSEMNMKLLEKIEELTLYAIRQEAQLKTQKEINFKSEITNSKLKNNNKFLGDRLTKLEAIVLKK